MSTKPRHIATSGRDSAAARVSPALDCAAMEGGTKPRRSITKRQRVYITFLAVGSLLTGALVAHALWSTGTTMAGGVVIAGDLNAEWQPDSFRWTEINDWAKGGQLQSGTTPTSLYNHRIGPGSKLKIEYDFTISGHGDNLGVVATLDSSYWNQRLGWVTQWSVVDSLNNPVGGHAGPQAGGTPLVFGPIHPALETFTFQLFVEVPSGVVPPFAMSGASNTYDGWYLGMVTLNVDQVRRWDGEPEIHPSVE
ncbi:MAG: hypothetical protein FWG16_04415 [Micrococcales bacterium]|nr:hypothetical protein [Micrococcales bacterium]